MKPPVLGSLFNKVAQNPHELPVLESLFNKVALNPY